MIFKKPKPADPAEALLKKAMDSDDTLLKQQATRYMLDAVAERCGTPADLYQILAAIPDPEQRFMVLDGVRPLLSFDPGEMVFEEPIAEIVEECGDWDDDEHDEYELGETDEGTPKPTIN